MKTHVQQTQMSFLQVMLVFKDCAKIQNQHTNKIPFECAGISLLFVCEEKERTPLPATWREFNTEWGVTRCQKYIPSHTHCRLKLSETPHATLSLFKFSSGSLLLFLFSCCVGQFHSGLCCCDTLSDLFTHTYTHLQASTHGVKTKRMFERKRGKKRE